MKLALVVLSILCLGKDVFSRDLSGPAYEHACIYSVKANKFPWTCYLDGVDRQKVLRDLKLDKDELDSRCIRAASNQGVASELPAYAVQRLPLACAKRFKAMIQIKQYKEADI